MGMGLIANNGFAMGKLSSLQNLGRSTTTLRAHSSRSAADYLQGVGATLTIAKGLSATGFLSYRAMDATLNKDGTATTIVTSGYHRTETELEKKDNLRNTTFGGNIRYQQHGIHAGLNAIATHLNRELRPNTSVLYRQHAAQGTDFLNFSADYGYVHHRFAFNGETAMTRRSVCRILMEITVMPLRMVGSSYRRARRRLLMREIRVRRSFRSMPSIIIQKCRWLSM